jgi:hypothetical protein
MFSHVVEEDPRRPSKQAGGIDRARQLAKDVNIVERNCRARCEYQAVCYSISCQ